MTNFYTIKHVKKSKRILKSITMFLVCGAYSIMISHSALALTSLNDPPPRIYPPVHNAELERTETTPPTTREVPPPPKDHHHHHHHHDHHHHGHHHHHHDFGCHGGGRH